MFVCHQSPFFCDSSPVFVDGSSFVHVCSFWFAGLHFLAFVYSSRFSCTGLLFSVFRLPVLIYRFLWTALIFRSPVVIFFVCRFHLPLFVCRSSFLGFRLQFFVYQTSFSVFTLPVLVDRLSWTTLMHYCSSFTGAKVVEV